MRRLLHNGKFNTSAPRPTSANTAPCVTHARAFVKKRKERNECEVITEGAPADQELEFSAFLLCLWPLQISQIKSLIIYEG